MGFSMICGGRLLWLCISGVPLHAWNGDNFEAIATVFGRVLEVQDWTEDKVQTHIGRVLVLTNSVQTICETICLKVDGHDFLVKVSEDVVEIVDFGPRYDLNGGRLELSLDEGSGCGDANLTEALDDSEVEETPPSLRGKAKGSFQLSLRQLKIVESLNNSNSAEDKEFEDGEIKALHCMGQDGVRPVCGDTGPLIPVDGSGRLEGPADVGLINICNPNGNGVVELIDSLNMVPESTPLPLGARLKIARIQASSSSQPKKISGNLVVNSSRSRALMSKAAKPVRSHSSTASINSRMSTSIHLGELVGFRFGKSVTHPGSSGANTNVK